VPDGWVNFGYQGQRAEIARDIPVEHVEWFHKYARRSKEPALRQGLNACGATEEEAGVFAASIVERIQQLGDVAEDGELRAKAG
jgi:hypothetical protein